MRSVFRACLTIASLLPALLGPVSARAQVYAIRDLGTLGGVYSKALYLNSLGQVVGEANNAAGETRPFLYSDGTMTDLGSLGGRIGYATGINDNGLVVGTSYTGDGHPHAFLYWFGEMVDLNPFLLGGDYSMASRINNASVITGSSGLTPGGNARHAFILDGSNPDLGTLGGSTSDSFAINSSNTICGGAYIGFDQFERACISYGRSLVDITSLGGSWATARDINDSETVVGEAQLSSGAWRAFVWQPGSGFGFGMFALNTFGGNFGRADGVNNHNEVVGTAQDPSGIAHAFYWSGPTGLVNLDSRLPVGSGWALQEAHAINNNGQIVGLGLHGNARRAFLMTRIGVKSFTIAPATVAGGRSVAATIQLNEVAPVNITVTLTSTNPNVIAPPKLFVYAGTSGRTFALVTKPTAAATAGSVTLGYGGAAFSAPITVRPPVISTFYFKPTVVKGGSTLTGTIALEASPAAPTTITLMSDSPTIAKTVSRIVIAPGSTTGTFTVLTKSPGAKPTNVQITATANGVSKSVGFRVNP